MSDIVERLALINLYTSDQKPSHLASEAAAEITRLRAALAAQQPPPGWRMVPEEPTQEMLRAAWFADDQAFTHGAAHGATDEAIWYAMLAAAPQPGETQ